ncbi:hypothetical protein HK101_005875 [Irineochytrium annulatum]|nr:hypothetical protein HK101_005875 [Irineochytrium annulatum]
MFDVYESTQAYRARSLDRPPDPALVAAPAGSRAAAVPAPQTGGTDTGSKPAFTEADNLNRSIQFHRRSLVRREFWTERAILLRIHYKNRNQHKGSLHFRRLEEVKRLLNRFYEVNIEMVLETILKHMNPSEIGKSAVRKKAVGDQSVLPPRQVVTYALCRTAGGYAVLSRLASVLEVTYREYRALGSSTYFLPLAVTVMGITGRLYQLATHMMSDFEALYDSLFVVVDKLKKTPVMGGDLPNYEHGLPTSLDMLIETGNVATLKSVPGVPVDDLFSTKGITANATTNAAVSSESEDENLGRRVETQPLPDIPNFAAFLTEGFWRASTNATPRGARSVAESELVGADAAAPILDPLFPTKKRQRGKNEESADTAAKASVDPILIKKPKISMKAVAEDYTVAKKAVALEKVPGTKVVSSSYKRPAAKEPKDYVDLDAIFGRLDAMADKAAEKEVAGKVSSAAAVDPQLSMLFKTDKAPKKGNAKAEKLLKTAGATRQPGKAPSVRLPNFNKALSKKLLNLDDDDTLNNLCEASNEKNVKVAILAKQPDAKGARKNDVVGAEMKGVLGTAAGTAKQGKRLALAKAGPGTRGSREVKTTFNKSLAIAGAKGGVGKSKKQ